MGRSASGVRGIKLKDTDYVVGMVIAKEEETLFTIRLDTDIGLYDEQT